MCNKLLVQQWGSIGLKKQTRLNNTNTRKQNEKHTTEKEGLFPGLHLLCRWYWSLCLGLLWSARTVKLMHTRPQILLTIVSTPHVWAPTGSQHINHSHGHSNPGKPVTSDSSVHRHMWYYIILHPKCISRTLISPKSTFKNIWKCFHSITEKGWNQIGLYTAIIFEIHYKKYSAKKSVIPAQNWLYAMFLFFFSPSLCYVFSLLQAKNLPAFLVQE